MSRAEGVEVKGFTNDNVRAEQAGGRVLPVEAQRLAGDVGNPLQLSIGVCEMPPDLLDILLASREIDEVDQAFQGIIDFMSDRGGEATRRCQLFRSHERDLRGISFADVAEDENDADHARVLIKDWRSAVVDMKLCFVFADQNGVIGQADNLARTPHHLHRVLDRRSCPLVINAKDLRQWKPVRLGFLPSCELLGNSVHEYDIAVGIAGDHRIPDTPQSGIQPLHPGIRLVPPTFYFLDLQVVGCCKFLKEAANLPRKQQAENQDQSQKPIKGDVIDAQGGERPAGPSACLRGDEIVSLRPQGIHLPFSLEHLRC